MISALLPKILFYLFACLTLVSAMFVILLRNPVHSVMSLVATFVCSAVLWLLLQAEFLALVLVFLYVGAVMTLFLFVVMMLNIDLAPLQERYSRLMPIAAVIMLVFLGFLLMVFSPMHFATGQESFVFQGPGYHNLSAIGKLLFTQYILPFEATGVLLLVAIVSAIALAFTGRRSNTLSQNISSQVKVSKMDRLRIVEGD